VKKTILFCVGLLIGYFFDLIPSLFEIVANTNVCIESCPGVLRGISLAIYAAMPLLWGVSLPVTVGKPHASSILICLSLASVFLMLMLTWCLYTHQHPQ
jgi:siroheme synthase